MPITMIISLSTTAILMLISVLFKIAGKLRLIIPFLYLLLTGTVLNSWASAHETEAFLILYALIALSILSWIPKFKNKRAEKRRMKAMQEDILWQTNKAREMGISLDAVHFDAEGNMRYNKSNEMVI